MHMADLRPAPTLEPLPWRKEEGEELQMPGRQWGHRLRLPSPGGPEPPGVVGALTRAGVLRRTPSGAPGL